MKRWEVWTVMANILLFAAVGIWSCSASTQGKSIEQERETSFTDPRDDKTYRTVVMPDGKTWMAENLNYQTDYSWCYGDIDSNCIKYGRLYIWPMAKKVCPDGWRLPTAAEWTKLANSVGDSSTVGTKLKSQTGWMPNSHIPASTDRFGFSALPGGSFYFPGHGFKAAGCDGYWWSATEGGGDVIVGQRFMSVKYKDVKVGENAWYAYMKCDNQKMSVWRYGHKYNDGYSVRCLRE